jgi:hypothetical protein
MVLAFPLRWSTVVARQQLQAASTAGAAARALEEGSTGPAGIQAAGRRYSASLLAALAEGEAMLACPQSVR